MTSAQDPKTPNLIWNCFTCGTLNVCYHQKNPQTCCKCDKGLNPYFFSIARSMPRSSWVDDKGGQAWANYGLSVGNFSNDKSTISLNQIHTSITDSYSFKLDKLIRIVVDFNSNDNIVELYFSYRKITIGELKQLIFDIYNYLWHPNGDDRFKYEMDLVEFNTTCIFYGMQDNEQIRPSKQVLYKDHYFLKKGIYQDFMIVESVKNQYRMNFGALDDKSNCCPFFAVPSASGKVKNFHGDDDINCHCPLLRKAINISRQRARATTSVTAYNRNVGNNVHYNYNCKYNGQYKNGTDGYGKTLTNKELVEVLNHITSFKHFGKVDIDETMRSRGTLSVNAVKADDNGKENAMNGDVDGHIYHHKHDDEYDEKKQDIDADELKLISNKLTHKAICDDFENCNIYQRMTRRSENKEIIDGAYYRVTILDRLHLCLFTHPTRIRRYKNIMGMKTRRVNNVKNNSGDNINNSNNNNCESSCDSVEDKSNADDSQPKKSVQNTKTNKTKSNSKKQKQKQKNKNKNKKMGSKKNKQRKKYAAFEFQKSFDDKKHLCDLYKECDLLGKTNKEFLHLLIREIIQNGYECDLLPDTINNRYCLLEVLNEKMNHPIHESMGKPLPQHEMLALLLYTSGDCNQQFCKDQRNGEFDKWPVFDLSLNEAIKHLSNHSKNLDKIVYSGMSDVLLNVKQLKFKQDSEQIDMYFKSFQSFSVDKSVAKTFRGKNGIILGLNVESLKKERKNSEDHHLSICDVSWISSFPDEKEVLIARGEKIPLIKNKWVMDKKRSNQYFVCDQTTTVQQAFGKELKRCSQ